MGDRVAASGGREVEGDRRPRGSAEEGSGEGGVARSRKNVQESDGRSGGMGEGEVNRGRRKGQEDEGAPERKKEGEVNRGRRKVQEDEGAPERNKEGEVNRGRRKVHEDEGATERKKDGEVTPERSRKKVQEGDGAQGRGGEDKVESSEGGGQEGRARKSAGHGRYGHRRDPATGHRLRRNKTPEPNLKAEPGPETADDARRERVKRSQSTPGEGRTPKISSSEEEEDRKPRRVLKVKGESASIRKVKEEEEKPRPAVRTRSKSRGREEDEGKENGWDKSAWWKSWPGWTQRIRGKSLERESLGGAPQALPRRRNKSLERPPVIREKEKRLAKKEEVPVARKRSKSKSPRSISDEEEKQRERERRPSVEESSDDFWKVGEGVRKRKVDERVVEIIDDRVPALEDVKPAAKPAEEEVGQSVPAEDVGKDQESRFKEKFKLSFSIVEAIKEWRTEWRFFLRDNGREVHRLKTMWQRCAVDVVLLVMYCGTGALVFRFTEGAFENFYKCGVKRVKREFVDGLWTGAFAMREDDWKSMARRKLWEFEEQLQVAFEAGSTSYSGVKAWSFVNAFLYCLTVVTTIGYGHISPVTTTGRAITMVYAIFGIPMFLIVLADFGKLFTRGIKFVWAFVRRVYYTGSCRKVRRTVPVHEMMKGVQMVYDIATFRRPSQLPPGVTLDDGEGGGAPPLPPRVAHSPGEPPGTPALSTFAIDDEFNLPISLAIFILLLYIICGALVFTAWEEWTFFESFYFVFISMSTIGFGDITPNHPMYMMASIIYLVFGLALTSMCINVVQEKLSDSFRQASAKIGATIGFRVGEDDGSVTPAAPPPVEIAEVHGANKTTTNGAPTST